jgi:hypothetical protein
LSAKLPKPWYTRFRFINQAHPPRDFQEKALHVQAVCTFNCRFARCFDFVYIGLWSGTGDSISCATASSFFERRWTCDAISGATASSFFERRWTCDAISGATSGCRFERTRTGYTLSGATASCRLEQQQ